MSRCEATTRGDHHPTQVALTEPRAVRRRGVAWFLTLAFVGAWVPWLVVYLAGGSLDDPVTQLLTAAFVPALAACVVRRFITRQGFANSGLRLHLRASWRHYLAALTIPWGVLVIALLTAAAAGIWAPSAANLSPGSWAYLAAGPLVCLAAAPLFWGEEYGWTAYLRDRLVPGRPILTTLFTGMIWGLWHWPLPWVGYFGGQTDPAEALCGMLLWLPLSVLLEFLIGWLWSESASVWPGAMLHAGSNLVVALGMTLVFGDAVGVTTTTILLCAGLVPFVLAVVVTGHTGGARRRVRD